MVVSSLALRQTSRVPRLPEGDPPPLDGSVPDEALRRAEAGPFGIYLHVPFCRVRCGYCDFNTYTLGELGQPGQPGSRADAGAGESQGPVQTAYLEAVDAELDLAVQILGRRPVRSVFVGGGTPTLLGPDVLGGLIGRIGEVFGGLEDTEVTTEANPDTVTAESLSLLRRHGVTRVSLGMQSSVPHVLATLDRTHRPENVARAVSAARDLGLATSLDLIYGTPGESLDDWRRSLETAIALGPDHISAYALVVEDGTRLAAQVRRGEVDAPDDDDEADKYELAESMLSAAGYGWYEVSNWSRTERGICHHNLGYWRGGHWWGLGPGAHSHLGGVRWWNVKHPTAYADRLARGQSPAAGRETLSAAQRHDEEVLLGVRLAEGLALDVLSDAERTAVGPLVDEGLLDEIRTSESRPRVVLTLRGRLLADLVVRRILVF